jgi:hypothetical protein
LVSGKGTIEKRETPQTQIYQYLISVDKRIQVEFELPASIGLLRGGEKVTISITTSKPKLTKASLTLHGEVYKIEKMKTGVRYIIFFSGLQGSITVKRSIPRMKPKKVVYLSISK